MILFLLLALGVYSNADKLDRTYLPPPGSKFAGGSPEAILPPIARPNEPAVSASTIRPIPGLEDSHLPSLEGIAHDLPNHPYSQRPGAFGAKVKPVSPQLPVVSSYSEATSQPGYSSSYSTATSVTPYHPFTTPSSTTSYAFSQTTTYSPIDDECVGSTCAYEQDGFVDTGIEPDVSISHQAPDHYSQANQGLVHSVQQAQQRLGYHQGFSTQAPIRTQTSSQYPQNAPAQRFDNRGRPITYEPNFSTQSPIRQQTPAGVTSQYPSQKLQGRPSLAVPGQVSYSTVRPTLPTQHLGTQPPAKSYQPSPYFDNQQPVQAIDQKDGYKRTKAPTSYTGTTSVPQGAPIYAQGQKELSYDQQGRPIQIPSSQTQSTITSQHPPQTFNQRGRPVSNGPVAGSAQYSGPSFPGQSTPQDIRGSTHAPSKNVDDYGRPIATYPNQPQLGQHGPIERVDEQGRPISLPSGIPPPYPGDSTSVSVDQQGHPISGVPSYQPGVTGPSTPNNLVPITSISPSDISRSDLAGSDGNAVIVDYKNIITPEGEFAYSYDTSNGIHADENGTSIDGVKAEGSYSYIGDDGKLYSIVYTADENGYQPHGEHLPTPPPIPEEILRVIEKVNLEKDAGIIDDGLYDEDKYGYKKYQGMMDLMQPPAYTEDDEYESDSGNIAIGSDVDDEITKNQHAQGSKVPHRERPFKESSQQSKAGKPQRPGVSISQSKHSRPSVKQAHVTSETPSGYEDEQDFTDSDDINSESTFTLSTQRPSIAHSQNKGRRPIVIFKPETRKPIINNDNVEDEYITDDDNTTEDEQLSTEKNFNKQLINSKGKSGVSRPNQNRADKITKHKQDKTRLHYDSRIPQIKQRVPAKSSVSVSTQQVSSDDDDEQYIDGLERDEQIRVDDAKQRRPSSIRGMMRQKTNKNKSKDDRQEEYTEEEISSEGVEDEKTTQSRPGGNRQGPTRNKQVNRGRVPQRKPSFDKVSKLPSSRYPESQVDESDEYFDSEVDTNSNTFESSSRRPTAPIQATQSSIRKGYDSSIQASTAKPSVIIQGEDKTRGYQYIPPRNMFIQDHVQGLIPTSKKHSFSTARPFTTPGFTQTTPFVNDGGVDQYYTTMPLGYFDSSRNISLPFNQRVQGLGILKPYGQRTDTHIPTTAAPSRRPESTRPSQRPQGRPGTFSTPSTPTAGTTRYPTTSQSKLTNNYRDDTHQTYPDSGISEYVTGSDLSQTTPSEYNTNFPSQPGSTIPSGRPSRPGYASTTNQPYYGSGDITQSIVSSQPGLRTPSAKPSRPGYSPTTTKPYYTATGSTTGYPSTGKPGYADEQLATPKPLPEYSDADRNIYTGVNFGLGVTGTPGASDISTTPGRLPSRRPGFKVPNLGVKEQFSGNEGEYAQGPVVDEYGRPIATQDRVKGEDFRGPKQPARFDPESGYHY